MKFLRRLLVFIIVVAALVICFRHFKPQISSYLLDNGIDVPGITDDTAVFPTSREFIDENGNSSIALEIPAIYLSEVTQEQIDTFVYSSDGRIRVFSNDDGSMSITMTDEYRDEILLELSSNFDRNALQNLKDGNILDITHNEDYSVFTVTCHPDMGQTAKLSLANKLFAIGKAYAALDGRDETVVRVDFTVTGSGEISNSYSSDNVAAGIANDIQGWAGDMFEQAAEGIESRIESIAPAV